MSVIQFTPRSQPNIKDRDYEKLCEFFDGLGMAWDRPPVPLERWTTMAQVLADMSGYHVILKAELLEPGPGHPNQLRSVGQREVGHAEPMLFVAVGNPVVPFPDGPGGGRQ